MRKGFDAPITDRRCINVSYYSFVLCKRLGLDYTAAARGCRDYFKENLLTK